MKILKNKIFALFAVIVQSIAESMPVRKAAKWIRKHQVPIKQYAIIALVLVLLNCGIAAKYKRDAEASIAEAKANFVVETTPEPQPTPTVNPQYKAEAEAIARVLYGVKDNSEQDLRTYIWCIFNRVDNPSREFANTLEDVIGKPGQWMFYDPGSPVLERLYQIAYSEVRAWHEEHRPVAYDFVYAEWSPEDIVLRNTWEYGKDTKTWRYNE